MEAQNDKIQLFLTIYKVMDAFWQSRSDESPDAMEVKLTRSSLCAMFDIHFRMHRRFLEAELEWQQGEWTKLDSSSYSEFRVTKYQYIPKEDRYVFFLQKIH